MAVDMGMEEVRVMGEAQVMVGVEVEAMAEV